MMKVRLGKVRLGLARHGLGANGTLKPTGERTQIEHDIGNYRQLFRACFGFSRFTQNPSQEIVASSANRHGFRASCLDSDLHSTFHRIFEGHLDSEQAVLVGRFSFVRFHRPT
jgi:hypothetical protein